MSKSCYSKISSVEGGYCMKNWFNTEEEMKAFINPLLMGPSSLVLIDELVSHLSFKPNMRILDLGCGTGLTSIYLAKKFGAQVIASDLWISPSENAKRFAQLEVDHLVTPIYAEAHQLPYAHNYFDMIIAIDSYHYFGYTKNYLEEHLIKFLKPGGTIAIAIPGLQEHCNNERPEALRPFWSEDMHFYSPSWWKNLWLSCDSLNHESIIAFELSSHQAAWQAWLNCGNEYALNDQKFIAADQGKYLNSVAVMATKKDDTN